MDNPPERKEVQEFKFGRMCNIRLFPASGKLDRSQTLNIVATSNKYGLVFAGTQAGVQCIPLTNVVELQDKRSNNRGVIENYSRRELNFGSLPSHIAVNSSGELMAVVYHIDVPVLAIYNVESFAGPEIRKVCELRLSSTQGTRARDLQWNPGIPNMIGAVCTDGSVMVSDFTSGAPKLASGPASMQATCLCWSPKGKQLAVGTKHGMLIQYKPDLTAVKTYPPPQSGSGRYEIISLHWLSSFQFIAVYKDATNPQAPSAVMVVNVPKGGPQKFINYEDICFGTDQMRHEHYFVHVAPWNLLFVSTGNGLEVSVLRQEGDSWVQWMQDDGARAELPQTENHEDVFTVGMAVNFNAVKHIPIGDTGFLPPMPYLLVMSEEGVMSIFHAINVIPNLENLCKAPQDVPRQYFTVPEAGEPAAAIQNQTSKANTQQLVGSGEAVQAPIVSATPSPFAPSVNSSFSLGAQTGFSNSTTFQFPSTRDKFPSFGALQPVSSQPQVAAPPPFGAQTKPADPLQSGLSKLAQSPFGFGSSTSQPFNSTGSLFGSSPAKPAEPAFPTNSTPTASSLGLQFSTSSPAVATTTQLVSEPQPVASSPITSTPLKAPTQSPHASVTPVPPQVKEIAPAPPRPPPVDELMIKNEMMKEFQLLKTLMANFKLDSSAVRKLAKDKSALPEIAVSLDDLEKFEKELTETTATEQGEVNSLKTNLVEMWGWWENIKARQRQSVSQRYLDTVESRDLDPFMKSLMKNIQQSTSYVESKIKEATNHLNSIWENQKEPGSAKNFDIPNMEAIYETITLNMRILSVSQSRVAELELKLANALSARKKPVPRTLIESKWNPYQDSTINVSKQDSQLEELADKLLLTRIDSHSESSQSLRETSNRYIALLATQPALSADKEAALWKWHKSHKVSQTKAPRDPIPHNDVLNRSFVKVTPTKPSVLIVETPLVGSSKVASRTLFFTPSAIPASVATSTPIISSSSVAENVKGVETVSFAEAQDEAVVAAKSSAPPPTDSKNISSAEVSTATKPLRLFEPQQRSFADVTASIAVGVPAKPKETSSAKPKKETKPSLGSEWTKSTGAGPTTSTSTLTSFLSGSTVTVKNEVENLPGDSLFEKSPLAGFSFGGEPTLVTSAVGKVSAPHSLSIFSLGTSSAETTSLATAKPAFSSSAQSLFSSGFSFGHTLTAVSAAPVTAPSSTAQTPLAPTITASSFSPSLFGNAASAGLTITPSKQTPLPGEVPLVTSPSLTTAPVTKSTVAAPTTPVSRPQAVTPEKVQSLSFGSMTLAPAAGSPPTTTSPAPMSFSSTAFSPAPTTTSPPFSTSGFSATITTTAATGFGTTAAAPASSVSSIFQTPPKSANTFTTTPVQPVFSSQVAARPTSVSPNTSVSLFGTPTTQVQPSFGTTTTTPAQSVFGTPSSAQSPFGAQPTFSPTTTAPASVFGTPTTSATSIFGVANALSNTSFFDSAAATPSANIFGGPSTPATTTSNVFGASICSPNVAAAPSSNTNIFGSPFGQKTSGSETAAFGGAPTFGSFKLNTAGAFGSSGGSMFGGSVTFGQQPQQGGLFQTANAPTNVFGSQSPQAAGGQFSGGSVVQQSGFGFGAAAQQQQQNSFGVSGGAVFGGQATFGSAPAFGGTPTFGGSPSKMFGAPTPAPSFGSPTSSTFENLAAQNTISFGNLTPTQQPTFGSGEPNAFGQPPPQQQQQQSQQPQPSAFSNAPAFGGSSFTSWR